VSEKEILISFLRTNAGSKLGFASLFLRFFENNALAECRIKLGELNLALYLFLVLARPDDVRRLCGLQFDKFSL